MKTMKQLKRLIHEVHRRSLWQVLSIYLVGSWIGYQVIVALTQGVGLPTWVPAFAIVLFIIGLPIVLATAFVQEGLPPAAGRLAPARGRRTRAARKADQRGERGVSRSGAEADSPRHHWLLTWQRAILGGIVAFLLLGMTAGGYMGLRNAGVGPFGSLIAAGALAERERVLIAEFQASPGDDDLARALTQAFHVDLAQSPVLHVLERGHAREVLERMGEDPTRPVTTELARQIALRDGIKAYVTGDVLRAGRGYSLSASLVSAADGALLASFRETAADSGAVLEAIGRLSRRMRERVGESLRTVNAGARLETVTTPSLEALRKYTAAVHALDIELDTRLGIALLQEAIAEDSTFGMAWRKLAVTYANQGAGRERVVEAATRAYEYRERMTASERGHAVAYYHMHVTRDYQAAIAAYRTLLRTHPDDRTAHNNIAVVYGWENQRELALEHQLRAVELNPHVPIGHTNLAHSYHDLGRLADAERALDVYMERFGETRALLQERAHLAFSRGEYDAVAGLAARLRDLDRADVHARANAAHIMADLAALRGRFGDEERHRDAAVAAEVERGAVSLPLLAATWLATRDLDVLGDPDAALRRLDDALQRHPLADVPAVDRPYGDLILLYARAGRPERARELLREFEQAVPPERRGDERQARLARAAALAFGERSYDEALRQLRRAAALAFGERSYDEALRQLRLLEPLAGCARCVVHAMAVVFDHAGQPDSAAVHYERFIAMPHPRRLWQDSYMLAPSHERLAEIYEVRGEFGPAMRHAAHLLELWENADPLLRPRVEAKRALLARLQERRAG